MKIILINPWYPIKDFLYRVSRVTPPLGIAYIASVLKEHGQNVKILDMVAANTQYEELKHYVMKERPDVVGMAASSPTLDYVNQCASIIRNVAPEVKIVIGGPHPTLLPEETLKQIPTADFVLRGESDYTFLQLVQRLENRNESEIRAIKGIGMRRINFISREIPLVEDLDSLPFPAFELLDMNAYYETHNPERKFFPMMTSRGCPYNCIFCNTPMLHGRKFRARSAVNVTEEMRILVKEHGVQHILFYDDTFTMDMQRAEEICDQIAENGLRVSWRIRTRVDRVNQDLLHKLRKSGCSVVSYGVETSSDELLGVLEKKYTIADVEKAFDMTKKAGIKILGYFILGIPTETKDDARRTIDFAKRLDPDYALFNIFTPLPGSKSYTMTKENLTTNNWSEFRSGVKAVVSYPRLSDKDLASLLDEAYRSFYVRKEWIMTRIREAKSIEEIEADVSTFFFYLEKGRLMLPFAA